MNLYETTRLEEEIELYASENDGEISDELLQKIVEAQTTSIEKVENLCHYIKHLESFVNTCKAEKERINSRQKTAENRIAGIKKYLLPYVLKHKKIDIGTMRLTTRKSSSVLLSENFNDPRFTTIVTEYKHDKNRIKKAIKEGEEVKGAQIIEHDNLAIK